MTEATPTIDIPLSPAEVLALFRKVMPPPDDVLALAGIQRTPPVREPKERNASKSRRRAAVGGTQPE